MKTWLIPHPNVPNAEFGDAHLKRVTTLFNENFAKLDALMQAAQASVKELDTSKSNDGHNHDEDYAQLEHKHIPDDVTGLSDLLDNKANLNHEHSQYLTEITAHQHETNEVNGLLEALNGKAPTAHGHTFADVDGLDDLSANAARTAYVDQRDTEKLAAAKAYTDAAISGIDVPEASSLTPYEDKEGGEVGTATSFAHGDHRHKLNYPPNKPTTDMKRDGAGSGGTPSFGTTNSYADLGHSHPLDVPTSQDEIALAKQTIALTKDGVGDDTDNGAALGATSFYARLDHIHALNVDTDAPPEISATEGKVGDSKKYAQSNHTHKMPTFTASKWMKTDTNGNVSTTNEQPIALDTSSTGLVFNSNGTVSYKSIGSSSGNVAAGDHTHAYGSASLTGFGSAAAKNETDFASSGHAHGNITSDGKIANSANHIIVGGSGGALTYGSITKPSGYTGSDLTYLGSIASLFDYASSNFTLSTSKLKYPNLGPGGHSNNCLLVVGNNGLVEHSGNDMYNALNLVKSDYIASSSTPSERKIPYAKLSGEHDNEKFIKTNTSGQLVETTDTVIISDNVGDGLSYDTSAKKLKVNAASGGGIKVESGGIKLDSVGTASVSEGMVDGPHNVSDTNSYIIIKCPRFDSDGRFIDFGGEQKEIHFCPAFT